METWEFGSAALERCRLDRCGRTEIQPARAVARRSVNAPDPGAFHECSIRPVLTTRYDGRTLRGANLNEGNLFGALLRDANLSTVNLSEANLNRADLSGDTAERAFRLGEGALSQDAARSDDCVFRPLREAEPTKLTRRGFETRTGGYWHVQTVSNIAGAEV